jgi:hypothetical protein
MRASEDPEHTAFVQSLSDGQPISVKTILSYKHLSRQEIIEDPETWKYAPVLVSTNKERLNIIRKKCKLWAQDHRTYVFKWRCRLRRQQNTPSGPLLQKALDHNAFFWQYFVYGAPCNLTTNINPDIALANGTPARLHSMTFDKSEDYFDIINQLEEQDVPYGDEIEINPPLAVNVTIDKSLDDKEVSERRTMQLQELQKHSLIQDSIVIPLTAQSGYASSQDAIRYSYYTGDPTSRYATADIAQQLPYDIGFSMTVHKSQGRTLRRIVIDLTSHPTGSKAQMEFAAVFVAMSRVRCKDHIRLVPHKSFTNTDGYLYLEDLKPNIHVNAFYHGFHFDENTYHSPWDPNEAIKYTS